MYSPTSQHCRRVADNNTEHWLWQQSHFTQKNAMRCPSTSPTNPDTSPSARLTLHTSNLRTSGRPHIQGPASTSKPQPPRAYSQLVPRGFWEQGSTWLPKPHACRGCSTSSSCTHTDHDKPWVCAGGQTQTSRGALHKSGNMPSKSMSSSVAPLPKNTSSAAFSAAASAVAMAADISSMLGGTDAVCCAACTPCCTGPGSC